MLRESNIPINFTLFELIRPNIDGYMQHFNDPNTLHIENDGYPQHLLYSHYEALSIPPD